MSNGTFFAVISNLFKLCKAMNSLITRLMLSAKKQEISNLSQLHLLIELFLKCAGLLHLLQRERGFSNLVMLSQDETINVKLLHVQQNVLSQLILMDKQVLVIQTRAEITAIKLKMALATALFHTEKLLAVRAEVQVCLELKEYRTSPCEKYSEMINLWLDVIIEAASLASSVSVSRLMLGLIYLLQAKEFAGLERAWGIVALAGVKNDIDLWTKLKVQQQSQIDVFSGLWSTLSSDLSMNYQEKLTQLEAGHFSQLRQIILGLTETKQAAPTLSETWFLLASERIDLLHELTEPICSALSFELEVLRKSYEAQQIAIRQGASEHIDSLLRISSKDESLIKRHSAGSETLFGVLREQSEHIAKVEAELAIAQTAIEEMKIIQKAKAYLIRELGVSEQDAHYQLQKMSMDQQLSLKEIASKLLL